MIYLDNAATTPVSNNVKDVIINALDIYGNPSSQYDLGVRSKKVVDESRHQIESILGFAKDTIIFTSGGSEADTFAIQAGWLHGKKRGRNKIIISSIEHHAVSHAAEHFKKFGAEVEYVAVDELGNIDIDDLKSKIDYNTSIVSIMASNNEVGTMINVYAISEIAHRNGALFHTDAVQGITHMNINGDVVDMMSISGHKFGAPKGIGALYINPFIKDDLQGYSLISGGKQEFGLRAGTENVPYIMGFAKAIEEMVNERDNRIAIERHLHNYLLFKLKENFPYIKVNGYESVNAKNPGILNFSIGFADAASLVEWMNLHDICISSGSACNTGSPKPSHVLMAMYGDEQRAFSSVRVSLSAKNSEMDINAFINALKDFERVYKRD